MATSNRVTLIQCTDLKRSGTHEARDLYDKSRYFRKMRDWAESRGDPWYILSAKHGLVHPSDQIEDYNELGISDDLAEQIAIDLHSMGVNVVHITAGRSYTDPLIPELEVRGIDVIEHFAGKRIGERERLLVEATDGT